MLKWEIVKWEDVITIKNGKNQKKVSNPDGVYPIYGSGGVMGYADDYLCPENTTIIGRKGSINKPIFVKEKFWNVDTAFGLCVGENLDNKFFFYFCKTYNFMKHNKATTLPSLTKADLLKIKIPLPPLPTQKKIAAILDEADSLRRLNKQVLDKYDALAESLFLDMFGDPVLNQKGWKTNCLENLLTFLTSGSRGWAKYYSESGDVFLRIQNVGYNALRLNDLTYVNTPNSTESKRTKVEPGDILLSITADLGRTAVIPENFPKAHINQHLAILRLNQKCNPYYLSAYIASKGGQSLFRKLDKGGVKAGLNFTDIKSYKVLCPPLSLQEQFIERLNAIETQKSQAQAALSKSEDLFNSLLQRAFKGELVK